MEIPLGDLFLPPVLCIPSLGAAAPHTVLCTHQAFREFCVNIEHSILATRMWFITETNSPVLIFREKRNALQARKLGIWERFQPGDFQQDLKKCSPPRTVTGCGWGGGLYSPFPSPVLVTSEDTEEGDVEPAQHSITMWIPYFKRDNSVA